MNHDATHCMDYDRTHCPKTCYRAQLAVDLELHPELRRTPLSYGYFKGISECARKIVPTDDVQEAICIGFSNRDCESYYRCPTCGQSFGAHDVKYDDNQRHFGKCPFCQQKLYF